MTKQEVLNIVREAIEEEPEYPGEMPDEMYEMLHNADKDLMTEANRISVRLTKQAILERIEDKLNSLESY